MKNAILLLLHSLMMSDSELTLPHPNEYHHLYCQYHDADICNEQESESGPESKVEEMIS